MKKIFWPVSGAYGVKLIGSLQGDDMTVGEFAEANEGFSMVQDEEDQLVLSFEGGEEEAEAMKAATFYLPGTTTEINAEADDWGLGARPPHKAYITE